MPQPPQQRPSPMQAAEPELILASGSAARRGLLEAAGLRFSVRKVALDEAALRHSAQAEGASAGEAALLLASAKAARVATAEALVIGADQILECEGEWFEKPADLAEARAHLLRLRDRRHELLTAIVCYHKGAPVWQHLARPRLRMRAFSTSFLDDYLAREGASVLESVGCYRLEGLGIHLFDEIEGEHAAILGLPLLALLGFLRQHKLLLA